MKKNIFSFFFLLIITFFPFAKAQALPYGPFGGTILLIIPCTCNIEVGDISFFIVQKPAAGPTYLIFNVAISRLYSYFMLMPGSKILGNTLGVHSCLVGTIPFCVPAGPGGAVAPLISIIGTSGGPIGAVLDGGSNLLNNYINQNRQNNSSNSNNNQTNQNNSSQTGNSTPCTTRGDTLAGSYIISNEKWYNNPYKDVGSDGVARTANGVGHDCNGSEPFPCNGHWTDAQVKQVFDSDYAKYQGQAMSTALRHGVDWNSLSPERQTVLTDMAFNMGSESGGGLDGFNKMWGNIAQAQKTGDQSYWNAAGAEVLDSSGYGKVPVLYNRASLNAKVMQNSDQGLLNKNINSDPQARSYCKNGL